MINFIKRGVVSLIILSSCSGKNEKVQPVIKPLREAVYASGYVVSKNEYQVFSQVDGYLIEILVKEGDLVKKNQAIFVIDSKQQNARYNNALEAYNQSVKNSYEESPSLLEIKATVVAASTKCKFDSTNFQRFANLLKSNATTQNEYDRAKLNFENSRNDLQLQRSRLKKLRDQLTLDLKTNENNLKIAAEESGRYKVQSEVDGRLYKTLKEQGELVRRSEAIAVIGSADEFYLQLSVDEVDIQKLKTGQRVVAKIDAFGNKTFDATLSKIYPLVNGHDQSLRVDAEFTSRFADAFSGLAVEANIIIREKEKAIVIPKSIVLPGDSVIVKTNGSKKKVKITRGIETLDELEVIEGIDANSILSEK